MAEQHDRCGPPEAGCRRHCHDFPKRHGQRHTGQPPGERRGILPGAGEPASQVCGDDDRFSRRAGSSGRRGPGQRGAEAGQMADPVVVPGPGWQDVPAPRGRCACGRGRARRRRRVRGARSEPAARGHKGERVPPDQSLARLAVSANASRRALPIGRHRRGGLGIFIGGALNIVIGVPSTARANGLR